MLPDNNPARIVGVQSSDGLDPATESINLSLLKKISNDLITEGSETCGTCFSAFSHDRMLSM